MSEVEEQGEGGGSGKVFLVLGLLIGAGLGAGAGFYFFGGSGEVTSDETTVAEVQNTEPQFAIPFERLAVPIYVERDGRRDYIGNYFVELQVNVYGQENQISVKRSQLQLQHAFISAITKGDVMRQDSPTELDIDRAAVVLKQKAAEVLGSGIIDSVTITNSMRIPN